MLWRAWMGYLDHVGYLAAHGVGRGFISSVGRACVLVRALGGECRWRRPLRGPRLYPRRRFRGRVALAPSRRTRLHHDSPRRHACVRLLNSILVHSCRRPRWTSVAWLYPRRCRRPPCSRRGRPPPRRFSNFVAPPAPLRAILLDGAAAGHAVAFPHRGEVDAARWVPPSSFSAMEATVVGTRPRRLVLVHVHVAVRLMRRHTSTSSPRRAPSVAIDMRSPVIGTWPSSAQRPVRAHVGFTQGDVFEDA